MPESFTFAAKPKGVPTTGQQSKGRKRHKVNTHSKSSLAAPPSNQPAAGTHRVFQTIHTADPGALALLRTFARQRRLLVDMRTGATNSVGGYLRAYLGFRWTLPKKERDRISKLATDIRTGKKPAPADVTDMVAVLQSSVAPIEARIKALEKQICTLVRTLPAWPWIQGVRGIAEISVGSLVGAAGDIARFRCPEGFFRVLGLSAPTGTPAEWYRPQGRAVAWCIGDGMLKAKSRYRAVYDRRKASTEGRIETKGKFEGKPWSKNHRHRDAHRVMTKTMLAELWAVWTGNEKGTP